MAASDEQGRAASLWASGNALTTISLLSVYFCLATSEAAMTTAMPMAVQALGAPESYGFTFSAFIAGSLVGMALAGTATERFPVVRVFAVGISLFGVGLALSAAAPAIAHLMYGRALQGLGAGLAQVSTFVIVGLRYGGPIRPRMMAAIATTYVIPSAVGPLAIGTITEWLGWRASFLCVLAATVPAAILVVLRCRFASLEPGHLRLMPVLAALVALAGVLLLDQAKAFDGTLLVAATFLALALVGAGARFLLPRGTLRIGRGVPAVIALRGVLFGAFIGLEIWLPYELVREQGWSLVSAGLYVGIGGIGWALGAQIQSRLGSGPQSWRRRIIVTRICIIILAAMMATQFLLLVPMVPLAGICWFIASTAAGTGLGSLTVLLFEFADMSELGRYSSSMKLAESLGTATVTSAASIVFALLTTGALREISMASAFAVCVAVAAFGAFMSPRISVPPRLSQIPEGS